MATVDIIVPSYGRSEILGRCLTALLGQKFQDIEILCVCRSTDAETRKTIGEFRNRDLRIREVSVSESGVVAALNAGLKSAQSPFVAFTDDDAEASPDWIATIVGHFSTHPECGAAGGPDRLQLAKESFSNPPPAKKVGVYSWTGKWYATHHCPIECDYLKVRILKGVNMVYKHSLIRGFVIGEGLKGGGTVVGWEQGLAAKAVLAGMELHFLRDAWVLHHCAPRKLGDDRTDFLAPFAYDASFNSAYSLWRYQPVVVSAVVQLRTLILGTRFVPGFLRLLVSPYKAPITFKHLGPSLNGAWRGLLARFGCA
jgi:cellulose synthase/poly-beta-1,6-N-acetylglucosamine synthase-like glycosyltransferase